MPETPGESILVTLCTFNERENLAEIIPEIRRVVPTADILVIDDHSPDGTGELADTFAANDPRVRVCHRPGKLGLGTATLAGFRHAIEQGYTYVVNLDADFSHHPRYIPSLLQCMGRADVAIGSRYVEGGSVVGWGPRRYLMSFSLNTYARNLLGLRTRDNTGSYRCYRVSLLRRLDLDGFLSTGYAFQEEVLFHLKQCGCQFCEVPIRFEERRYGVTKINWREAVQALWVILRLAFRSPRRHPRRENRAC